MWTDILMSNFQHKIRGDQIILKVCPFCGNDKWNLEFSISKSVCHCWVCNFSSTAIWFLKLNHISAEEEPWKITRSVLDVKKESVSLNYFVDIYYRDHPIFFHSKGIDESDIKTYGFLTAVNGKYKGRLIIPLYEGKKLVYLVGRELKLKGKYLNPQIERSDILPYYLGTREDKLRVYLCEGIFDAISINKIGCSSIPLLGTSIGEVQIQKLKKFGFTSLVVCLDGDALKKSIKLYKHLSNAGFDTYIVFFDKREDPNDLFVRNKQEFEQRIFNPKKLEFSDEVKVALGKL